MEPSSDRACSHQHTARGKNKVSCPVHPACTIRPLPHPVINAWLGQLSGLGEVAAMASWAQASLPNIKNICLPAWDQAKPFPHSVTLTKIAWRTSVGAVEIRIQGSRDKEG